MGDSYLWDGGRVFTGRRWCEALLIEDGRVTFVGTSAEARRVRPSGAETIDARGRLVLPGLIDAHVHLAEITRAREELDLSGLASIAELVERVRAWSERFPKRPVLGRGWDADRFSERRWPTARDLDRTGAGRPVILYHTSGHALVASSVALKEAGLGPDARDPPDGKLGRGSDGALNGLAYEAAMRPLSALVDRIAPPSPGGIHRTLELASAFGLTTVATMNTGREEVEALRQIPGSPPWPVRVRSYLRLSALDVADRQGSDGEPLSGETFGIVGVKGFTDGAFGPRTACLSEPFADAPEESGLSLGADEEFRTALDRAAALGLAPALHAIGDRAVGRATGLLDGRYGRTRAPPRIEHAALTPPALLPGLERVRATLVVQPGFLYSDWWLRERLGPVRVRWAYAFRTLLERGLSLAGSSDAPYDPLDPWRGLRAAVERVDPLGRSANPAPEEALSAEAAVQLYTAGGGSALGEPRLGTLEEGTFADLVVVRAARLELALRQGKSSVEETWLGGRRTFRAPA